MSSISVYSEFLPTIRYNAASQPVEVPSWL